VRAATRSPARISVAQTSYVGLEDFPPPFPQRLALKLFLTLEKEKAQRKPSDGLQSLMSCVDSLAEVASDSRQRQATKKASVLLSMAISERIKKMKMAELADFSVKLAKPIEEGWLDITDLQPAMTAVVQNGIKAAMKSKLEPLWDLQACVQLILKLQELDAEVLPSTVVACPLLNLMKRGKLERLKSNLDRAERILGAWPAAMSDFTLMLEAWLPAELKRLAFQWSSAHQNMQPSSPSSPSSPGPVPCTWDMAWWLDMLLFVVQRSFVDRASIRELCDVLVPGLAREGIRTESTRDWPEEGTSAVVARQLAAELSERPSEIQFMRPGLLLFRRASSTITATASQ